MSKYYVHFTFESTEGYIEDQIAEVTMLQLKIVKPLVEHILEEDLEGNWIKSSFVHRALIKRYSKFARGSLDILFDILDHNASYVRTLRDFKVIEVLKEGNIGDFT